jgi:hypothetical protein
VIVAPPPPIAIEAPTPAAADCAAIDAPRTRLVVQQRPARPGATLSIGAVTGPWAMESVPARCLTDWRVSSAAVTLSADHERLTVAADATPGETVEISALMAGRRVTVSVRMVGATEISLTGYWSQKAVDCAGGRQPSEPVRELHFDDKGGYSVTFTPFESYKDYWGAFALDAATGDLVMTYDGGNRGADGLDLAGKASLGEGDQLVLDGVFLGDRQDPVTRSCRYVFAR